MVHPIFDTHTWTSSPPKVREYVPLIGGDYSYSFTTEHLLAVQVGVIFLFSALYKVKSITYSLPAGIQFPIHYPPFSSISDVETKTDS